MIKNRTCLEISFGNAPDYARYWKIISERKNDSGLRAYEGRMVIKIYPPDGFNTRLGAIDEQEYSRKWDQILADIDSIFKA